MKTLFLFLSLIILTTACEFNRHYTNRLSDKEEAEKFMADFYSILKQKQYPEAYTYIHPKLWKQTDSMALNNYFVSMSTLLPVLKERKLDHWETKVEVGYEPVSFYKLFYIEKFENVEVKVSIYLRKDRYIGMKIIGYNANQDKFF